MTSNETIMDLYTNNINEQGGRICTWKHLAQKHNVSKKKLSSVSAIRKYSTDEEFKTFRECMYAQETVLLSNGTSSGNIEHIITIIRRGCKIIGKGKNPKTTHSRKGRSCAYLLESGGYYKVGVTLDASLDTRILALQTGNPIEIKLVAKTGTIPTAYELEKTLHERFKSRRIRGEWFALTEKDVTFIRQLFSTEGQYAAK